MHVLKKLTKARNWARALVASSSIVIVVATGTASFAGQPNESNTWSQELAGGNALQTRETMHEVRTTGNLEVRIWRGETDSQVWFSSGDNGTAYTVGGTNTQVAPTIVRAGTGLMALHVGSGNQLYYSTSRNQNPQSSLDWNNWQPVPNAETPFTPGAAQLMEGTSSPQGTQIVFRGNGSDNNIYSQYWTPDNGWTSFQRVGGATTFTAPAIAWQTSPLAQWGTAQVVYTGLDNRIWRTQQNVFDSSGFWTTPTIMGNQSNWSNLAPAIVWDSGTRQNVVAAVNQVDRTVWSVRFNDLAQGDWQQETTNTTTSHDPSLVDGDSSTFLLLTDAADFVWWKRLT